MIDFQYERVKEMVSRLSIETGMSLEQIIEAYKYFSENVRYVRFDSGEYKGKVGYVFPLTETNPYAVTVITKDSEIWCPRYREELTTIPKEEYEKAIKENADD